MELLIETARTFIRPLLPEDDKGLFLMDAAPEVHRYVGKTPVTTIEQSRNVIAFVRQQYHDNGIGRWAMLEKSTGEFIGWIGFKFMTEPVNKHSRFYDFGYRLRQEFWGRGYATEGALASLNFGLDVLHLKDIYAMTDIDNLASRRVLEKVGFRLMEIFPYDAEPNWRAPNEPTTWYAYDHKNISSL